MVGLPKILDSTLLDVVKGILLAPPLDLYNKETELAQESSLELVEPRNDSIEIGSANIFTAIILLLLVKKKERYVRELTESEAEEAGVMWDAVLAHLKQEGFLRIKPQHLRDNLKLIINNE